MSKRKRHYSAKNMNGGGQGNVAVKTGLPAKAARAKAENGAAGLVSAPLKFLGYTGGLILLAWLVKTFIF